jgi:nucleotide-binding universal stress UspA family protein
LTREEIILLNSKQAPGSESYFIEQPFVNSILHPSDFTLASENAFAHALALSLIRQTKLTILHAGDSKESWTRFPAVRQTLERWGYLEKDSPRSAVFEELKIRVEKITLKSNKPLRAVTNFLKDHPRDLIVLATEREVGPPKWIRPTEAEQIAHRSNTLTLFIPGTEGGFISKDNGNFYLKRILVPIDHRPSPLPAIEYAARAAGLVRHNVEIIIFYAGEAAKMPAFTPPENPVCTWRKANKTGEVVTEIINAAQKYSVDLIVMATAGHDGFLDALRGSVTEQVLRRVPCPLLAVPVV